MGVNIVDNIFIYIKEGGIKRIDVSIPTQLNSGKKKLFKYGERRRKQCSHNLKRFLKRDYIMINKRREEMNSVIFFVLFRERKTFRVCRI